MDYAPFKFVLPYASEIFGVYQPMIGWRSRRQLADAAVDRSGLLAGLAERYAGIADVEFNADNYPQLRSIEPGALGLRRLLPHSDSRLLEIVSRNLRDALGPHRVPEDPGRWQEFLDPGVLEEILAEQVFPAWRDETWTDIRGAFDLERTAGESEDAYRQRVQEELGHRKALGLRRLEQESAWAGLLRDVLENGSTGVLEDIFYGARPALSQDELGAVLRSLHPEFTDPFAGFDPKSDLKDVSLSPIGVVHLFRQYFYEFDTFLGTPAGHVWLSPGSSVELIETSTRKTLTERTVETGFESVVRTEREATDQDDVSEAVKQENRDDTKLGFSTTATQSWGTGDVTATGSLNLDRTQQTAREQSHRRMRQQSQKLSTEIRENFRSTFRTVTEVTDVSSKRYVLANSTRHLINYELRRKMRRVGVQVQDIGTHLCWQTFVDEPGRALGLANLVHIAEPADLAPQPNRKEVAYPPRLVKSFQANAVWNFGDVRKRNHLDLGFIPLTTVELPVQLEPGYQFERPPGDVVPLGVTAFVGEDAGAPFAMTGRLTGTNQLLIGVVAGPGGIEWDRRIDITVVGEIAMGPTPGKIAEVDAANAKILDDRAAATREEERAIQEAFHKAAKERIEQAASVKPRTFEDLREEERTVVYRALIQDLMTSQLYRLPDRGLSAEALEKNRELRHVLSELINAVFDIDKMLYFVAPEWWKPRKHYSQYLGRKAPVVLGKRPPGHGALGSDMVVNWSDNEARTDNYYITDSSEPAALGSSLGWLLQLDGDNHRNAFLNAPWVKAVIPIRPGKEQAAISWLQNVNVEGADGLDKPYAAPAPELETIRADLLAADPDDPVADPPTIGDAIRYLCLQVARKHAESVRVKTFPTGVDIHDDDKVSATPVEKVYEHGFYPLQGGFRVDPQEPDPNDPERHFALFDQWTEILPTDQIVPVEVAYDPMTGRQVPVPERPDTDPEP